MSYAPNVVRGPTLYRYECRQCAEETLHNAHGCYRCGTPPWTKPVKIAGNARRMLTTGLKRPNW